MRNEKGQFKDGEAGASTRFKKGEHWRKPSPLWDKEWIRNAYVVRGKSAAEIASMFSVTEAAVLFWLRKHGIPRRSMAEIRAAKHWGSVGEKNPMYGKRGVLNPNWSGGLTPLRQTYYGKSEMRQAMRDVYIRDKSCRLCGSEDQMEVHHIDPFSQAPLLVMEIGNMILLCAKCHRKMRGKEMSWRKKLLKLINKKGG